MRCCACCRMPAKPAALLHGEIFSIGVVVGVCARCEQAHERLPRGTVQKRLNAAYAFAAADTSGRYWTARFKTAGAAALAAHMVGHQSTTADALEVLGWQ